MWQAPAPHLLSPERKPQPTDHQLDSLDNVELEQVHASAWTRHRRKLKARAHAARVAALRRQNDPNMDAKTRMVRAMMEVAAGALAGHTTGRSRRRSRSVDALQRGRGRSGSGASSQASGGPSDKVPGVERGAMGRSMRDLLDVVKVRPSTTQWRDVGDDFKVRECGLRGVLWLRLWLNGCSSLPQRMCCVTTLQAASKSGFWMSYEEFPPGWQHKASSISVDADGSPTRSSSRRGSDASHSTAASDPLLSMASPRGSTRSNTSPTHGATPTPRSRRGKAPAWERFTDEEEAAALATLRARSVGVSAALVHHAAPSRRDGDADPAATAGGFAADGGDDGVVGSGGGGTGGQPSFSSDDSEVESPWQPVASQRLRGHMVGAKATPRNRGGCGGTSGDATRGNAAARTATVPAPRRHHDVVPHPHHPAISAIVRRREERYAAASKARMRRARKRRGGATTVGRPRAHRIGRRAGDAKEARTRTAGEPLPKTTSKAPSHSRGISAAYLPAASAHSEGAGEGAGSSPGLGLGGQLTVITQPQPLPLPAAGSHSSPTASRGSSPRAATVVSGGSPVASRGSTPQTPAANPASPAGGSTPEAAPGKRPRRRLRRRRRGRERHVEPKTMAAPPTSPRSRVKHKFDRQAERMQALLARQYPSDSSATDTSSDSDAVRGLPRSSSRKRRSNRGTGGLDGELVRGVLSSIAKANKAGERWSALRKATKSAAHTLAAHGGFGYGPHSQAAVHGRALAGDGTTASARAAREAASKAAQRRKTIKAAIGMSPKHASGVPPPAQKAQSAFHALLASLRDSEMAKAATARPPPGVVRRHTQFPPLVHLPAKPPGHTRPVPAHRRMTKERLHSMVKFTAVAAGERHSGALSRGGKVFMWGTGLHGVLGVGTQAGYSVPVLVRDLSRLVVTHLACGSEHTVVCASDGRSFAWGSNRHGQLGVSTDPHLVATSPLEVAAMKSVLTTKVCAGDHHTLFMTADMGLWATGNNMGGQLGFGDRATRYVAEVVPAFAGPHDQVFAIAAGAIHSACVTTRGELFTWGYGGDGRLGHGDTRDRLQPTLVRAFAQIRSKYTFLLRDVHTKLGEAKRCVRVHAARGSGCKGVVRASVRNFVWACRLA